MSISITVGKTLGIDGKTYAQNSTVVANSVIRRDDDLPAAKAGTLTTRTDDDTGELTMSAGHGITTGVKLDVYWNIGGVPGSRRNMTVGTVAVNAVPIDGGTGDVLPADESLITAMIPVSYDLDIDGSNLKLLAVTAEDQATFVFAGVDGIEDYAFVLQFNGQVKEWYFGSGEVNPIVGDTITQVLMTHASSSGAKKLKVSAGVT